MRKWKSLSRRGLSLLMALTLCVGLLQLPAFAAGDCPCGQPDCDCVEEDCGCPVDCTCDACLPKGAVRTDVRDQEEADREAGRGAAAAQEQAPVQNDLDLATEQTAPAADDANVGISLQAADDGDAGVNLLADDDPVTGYKGEDLPEGPDMTGSEVSVTPENAQYTLDGAYGSIDGKTIRFTGGTYSETLYINRPTKFAGSGTVYYKGYSNRQPVSSITDLGTGVASYTRDLNNVTLTADSDVILPGFQVIGCGHHHTSGMDYVREHEMTSTNDSFYFNYVLNGLTFDGLTIQNQVEFPMWDDSAQVEAGNGKNITFDGCKFLGDTSQMGSLQAIKMGASKASFRNVVIRDCEFTNYFQGIYIVNVDGTSITNNTVTNTKHNAIALQNGNGVAVSGEVLISGNTMENIQDRCIRFGNIGADADITVSGNTATNSGDSAGEIMKAGDVSPSAAITITEDNDWGGKTVVGDLAKTPVAEINGKGYRSLQGAIDAAKNGETVTLVADSVEWPMSEKNAVIEKKITINLSGKLLNITGDGTYGIVVQNSGELTIENGSVNANDVTRAAAPVIEVTTGSSLTLDAVDFETMGAALFPRGDAAKVSVVNNSKISAPESYAVATNASGSENYNVIIELKDSTFIGNSPVLINVPGRLVVDHCQVTGDMHGIIVRGGTAEIKNSEVTQNYPGNNDNAQAMAGYFEKRDWGSGNMVNLAAITIGNKGGTAYQYPSNVIISNTEVNVAGSNEALFPCVYVWANEDPGKGVTLDMNGVTFTGTHNPQVEYGNGKSNITENESAAKVDGKAYPTLEEAIKAAGSGDTVTLLKDVAENATIANSQNIVLDLNGKMLRGSAANKDYSSTTYESVAVSKGTVTNYGILTITDSAFVAANGDESKMGKIVGMNVVTNTTTNATSGKIALVNMPGATCTIESGMITRQPYLETDSVQKDWMTSNYTVQNLGKMYITGGRIVNNSTYSSMVVNYNNLKNNKGVNSVGKLDGVYMEISGGVLEQNTYSALKNDVNAHIVIKDDAKIVNTGNYVTQFYGTADIMGGSFTGGQLWICSFETTNSDEASATAFPTKVTVSDGDLNLSEVRVINGYGVPNPTQEIKAEFNITGGNITCKTWYELKSLDETGQRLAIINDKTKAQIAISGGSFSNPVAEKYCAENYVPVDLGNGKYSVTTKKPLNGVTLSQTTATIETGKTLTLTVTYDPADTTDDKTVTWRSSDTDVAMVDEHGVVTAAAEGKVTITATVGDKTADCEVTVTAATIPATGVTLTPNTLELTVGGTGTLTATVTPADTTDSVTWTSGNTAVATVENGVVTAIAPGETTITATAGDKTATCVVTVTAAPVPNYTVTFNWANNGTRSETVPAGSTITAPTVPSYTSGNYRYTFSSWSPAFSATVTADATYTAQYTRSYIGGTGGTTGGGSTSRPSTGGGSSSGGGGGRPGSDSVRPGVTIGENNTPLAETPFQFTDVAEGSYCYDAVAWAVNQGITGGVTATTFAPNGACTRAQIVTFLWRAAGSPTAEGENPFTDVAADAYYYNAVLWAVAQGITGGTTATTFSPNATCTRGQAVTFLYRAAGSPEASGTIAFTDVTEGAYYYNAVLWAVEKGVTGGTSATTFAPNATCTRGQIVTFLHRDRA